MKFDRILPVHFVPTAKPLSMAEQQRVDEARAFYRKLNQSDLKWLASLRVSAL